MAAPAALGSGATLGAGTLIGSRPRPDRWHSTAKVPTARSRRLSRHIGTPGLEVQQMLTRVRAEVVAKTRGKQVPWSNSSLLGEVYLAAK